MNKWLPIFDWLPNYKQEYLKGDLIAGVIVAIMLIPQGMAYAVLAGLPPITGLYAAAVPLVFYALFSTSRHLAVGPVATVSLLVLAGVSVLAEPGTSEYISLALLLALMVGVIQFLLGLFKLGFLTNYISAAVISGFTSAIAIVIGLSQLKHLLGVNLVQGRNVFHSLWEAIQRAEEINLITLSIGIGSILLMVVIKKRIPRIPGPLAVVILSILLVYIFQLQEKGVQIVGHIPGGLPVISIPTHSLDAVSNLLPIAFTIAFLSFLEAVAIAKVIAAKEKYKIDPNKELKGLGVANISSSLFSAYPIAGSFSRSALNYQTGAQTGLANIITGVCIGLTLLFFTSLLYYLPMAVLAAIIMVVAYGLIDIKGAKRLFQVKKVDGWILLMTFMSTLIIGVNKGVLIGVIFSLLVMFQRSARPHMTELGYLEQENVFRSIQRYPDGQIYPGVLIFRMDASLYFANMAYLEEKIRAQVVENKALQWIILDLSGVNNVDAVSLQEMERVMNAYRRSEIEILLANVKGPVRDLMGKAGWEEKYGEKIAFLSIQQALQYIEQSKT